MSLDAQTGKLDALHDILDEEERRRAASIRRRRIRSRFIVAHAALRQILGRYTAMFPSRLRFVRGAGGKPVLGVPGPHFNLSHSGGVAIVAVSADRPVGVDVERVRATCDVEGVARRHFSAPEAALVLGGSERERRERFFRLWTCKESCLKECGRGLGGLDGVEIAFDAGGVDAARDASGHWALKELRPLPGYVAAVATREKPLEPELRSWAPARSPA